MEPSTMSRSHHIDVQPFLASVCDSMAVGELLCGDHFSLQDAMVAIEIGDVKMDVGLRRGDPRSAEELIAAALAPTDLTLEQQLGVIDRLFQMEATWQTGSMLSQTIFTSLYLLDTARLQNEMPVLYAAAKAIRSTSTLLHEAVMAGQVVDDEDLLMHVFGFKLDLPGPKPVKEAQQALEDGIKAALAEKGQLGEALATRLRFRSTLLKMLQNMHPASEKSLTAAAELCDEACALLDKFQTSSLSEDVLAAAPGFAPEVHRKAMGLAPPRPVNVLPFEKAIDQWKATIEVTGQACRWLVRCSGWQDLKTRLMTFAATPRNLPIARTLVHRAIAAPIRAAAAAAAAAVSGPPPEAPAIASPPNWCPSEAMIAAEFGWSTATPPSSDAKMFIEQCAIAMQAWCHTMCLNRCRQRRRLRRILEDWRNMTDHGFNAELSEEAQQWFEQHGWKWKPADEEGQPLAGPITAWVETEAAWSMSAHLMLGFQLDLYAPHEFSSVYWYCDYLVGSGEGAQAELQNMRPAPGGSGSAGTKKTGKGGGKAQQRAKATSAATAFAKDQEQRMAVAALSSKADRMMCQATMRISLALTWLGMVGNPPAPFNSEYERFIQRFNSFEALARPAPLSYEDFVRSTSPGEITPQRLLLAAFEAFASAQNAVTSILDNAGAVKLITPQKAQHMAGIKRIAAQNIMAVKLLINSITGPNAAEKPPFSVGWEFKTALQYSTVMFYPSLVLKSAKK